MSIQKKFKISGMHCVSCAGIIEKSLKKIDGVSSAEVNYSTESLTISFDESKSNSNSFSPEIEKLGYTLIDVQKVESLEKLDTFRDEKISLLKKMKNEIFSAIPIAIFTFLVMAWEILMEYNLVPEMGETLEGFIHKIMPLLATYVLFTIGKPYLSGITRFLRYGKANMDTLIGIGTITAYVYSFIVTAFGKTLLPFLENAFTYYDVTIIVIIFV